MQAFEVSEDMSFLGIHFNAAICQATKDSLRVKVSELTAELAIVRNNWETAESSASRLLTKANDLEAIRTILTRDLEHAQLLNLKMLDQLGNQKPQPQVQPVEPKEKKKPKISLRNAMSRAEQVDD